ncbi:hypothetical protein CY652_22870 [Burkholderia sp. WAC0059]|uniref:hypothetical protein n=1 Tax=Burkholderia sp. WAC0059 TaxID=2066022 RepID=UPI000C7EEA0B|nr:hypothetical protein [Burkholderia sp. WAC0059]PLZ00083.1 hypothetical protein CY652_22870 [Burkholderia sp. WAC0059]
MPIVFRLKYTPTLFGPFVETPVLEWKEVITLLDHAQGEYWVYVGDQYQRNMGSTTFGAWRSRYTSAYEATKLRVTDTGSILMDKHGRQVKSDALPDIPANDFAGRANAVRAYLKRNGGVLEVTVEDSPGLLKPGPDKTTEKERILTFDCGFKGMGRRIYAWQYLKVNSNDPAHKWTREFKWDASCPGVKTSGLKRVQPPQNVSELRPWVASFGEYA